MSVAENHHPAVLRPRHHLSALGAPLLLLLLTIGVFWKLTLTDQYTWMAGGDTARQVLPWYQFQASEFHAGRFPLWDPYHWGGQPLLAQGIPGAAYPLNWILFSLPLRDGWIQHKFLNWYFVLIHYMAALFCYLLCRDLQCSRAASLFAGLVFGLGGFVGSTSWPQMLNGAVWAPPVFLFLFRAMRGQATWPSAALGGMFLGISLLSGHHQIPMYIALAAGGMWLWHIWRNRWRGCGPAALFVLFAALTGGLQALPGYEYGALALRWVNLPDPVGWQDKVPYEVHRQFSFPPASLLGLVVTGFDTHANLFLGWAAASMAFLGVVCCWERWPARALTFTALFGVVFSLGERSFLHGVLYSLLPILDKARNPAMAIFLVSAASAPLAAFGFDALMARPVWARRLGVVGVVFGALVLVFLTILAAADKAGPETHSPVTTAAIAALITGALLLAWARETISWPALAVSLTVVALIELGNLSAPGLTSKLDRELIRPLTQMSEHADIVEFLRQQPGPFRVNYDQASIPYNFGDWHGVEVGGGFLASLTRNIYALDVHEARTINLLGIGYTVGKESPRPGESPVFESASGMKVFRNTAALPRAWAVHRVHSAPHEPAFDPAREAVITGTAPVLESCEGGDEVRVLDSIPGHIRISAGMKCRGLVILAETFFPGWQATLDGAAAEILEVDGALRGVVVPQGSHIVGMQFRPRSVYAGAMLSAIGVLGALGLAVASGRRRS